LSISDFAGQHLRLFLASILAMAPLFAISTYFGWVSDDASLILRAVRLFVILALAGLGFLFAGHHLKVAEIAGLRGFATSLLNRRKR